MDHNLLCISYISPNTVKSRLDHSTVLHISPYVYW